MQTLSSLTDFSLYNCSSSFSISPDSTLTQLHTFLTLSYSFLLILVDSCPTPKGVFPTVKSKHLYALSAMLYLYDLRKLRTFGVSN
jgi:hypothetical protein